MLVYFQTTDPEDERIRAGRLDRYFQPIRPSGDVLEEEIFSSRPSKIGTESESAFVFCLLRQFVKL